jgi:hypothetical protein
MRIVVELNSADVLIVIQARAETKAQVDKLLNAIVVAAQAVWPDYQPSDLTNPPEGKP